MQDSIPRKIIHIDMDCFYAAIEIRDNPALENKPVAVGGSPDQRGVLCTCNYIARRFGVRSAMATAYALRLCPDLIVLPVNMPKYREAAKIIHAIFRNYTDLIEPLSLDEAFLDVTHTNHQQGSGTLIAKEIRQQIWNETNLPASAGVAPNKFLAKIASGWKKPNGLFVIAPPQVESFVKNLPLTELFGVGKVTAEKLDKFGFKVCSDLYVLSASQLIEMFGKFGQQLFDQSRGIDLRPVEPNRIRKSLSVEETFVRDLRVSDCSQIIIQLHQKLLHRLAALDHPLTIKNQFIKVKFSDFKQTSIERISDAPDLIKYKQLFQEINCLENKTLRLIGLGVHFGTREKVLSVPAQQVTLEI